MGATRVKLAVLLQDLEFGGTQRYAVNLLKHIDRGLFEPELWVLRGGDDMLPLAQATGCEIVRFSQASWVDAKALAGLFLRLTRSTPDVLYTLTVVPNVWGRLFGCIARVPAIVTSLRNGVARQHDRWLWRLSTRIVVNADSLKELILRQTGMSPDRVDLVPNGVDIHLFHPEPARQATDPTIIFVGRLIEQKDPLTLLEAFRLTVENVPSARLIMVGNGHLRPLIDRFIAATQLRSRVTVLDGVLDIRSHLMKGWLLALSSVFEGSPNVAIEAMAMCLPVVSTRVDGIPELIVENETGLTANPGDPMDLSRALTALLSDAARCREMGAKAREYVVNNRSMELMARLSERSFLAALDQARRA